MTAPYVLGIDLGTTNTVAAVWAKGDDPPEVATVIQPSNSAAETTDHLSSLPSVVGFDPVAGVLVGDYVLRKYGRLNSDRVVQSVKRHMGTRWVGKFGGTRDWLPEDVSGCILRAVRDGLRMPGGKRPTEPPLAVVVTVPACFGTEQRRATLTAAALAEFDAPVVLFDEPAAAMLYQTWADREGGRPAPGGERFLVLDMGGGTLDASYMTVKRDGDTFEADLLGRSRYNELGGDDIDLNIAGLLLERYTRRWPESEQWDTPEHRPLFRTLCAELLVEARRLKETLCERAEQKQVVLADSTQAEQVGELYMPPQIGGVRPSEPDRLTYRDLAKAVAEFMPMKDKTKRAAADIKYLFTVAVEECLASVPRKAGDPLWPAVDTLYLTGGSAYLPMLAPGVRSDLERLGLNPFIRRVDRPMDSVALGAALYAGAQAGFPKATAFTIRERMFEGVYLRNHANEFAELVRPLTEFHGKPIRTTRPVRMRLPGPQLLIDLFTGFGPHDPDLQPLQQRALTFTEPLDAGQEVLLEVTVDLNRRVEFACHAKVNGADVPGTVERLRDGQAADSREPLPAVNACVGGAP